jgi:hypothetical protein
MTVGRVVSPTAPTIQWSANMGFGCIALFLLPFGAVGLFATLLGIRRAMQGSMHDAGVLLVIGPVFTGVAAIGWTLLLLGRRKQREQEALQARHPAQPWLWRSEWASGRLTDSSRGTLWTSWIFATIWNLISFPSAFLALRSAHQDGNRVAYIALLFPLAGSGLLAWAVRNTLRYWKYGASVLELSTLPGVVGHSLSGRVRASCLLQPAEGFELVLSCIRRVTTRSGKDSSTTETILWQEEQRVRAELSRDPGGMVVRVPIGFRIPGDALGTDFNNPNDQIIWRLAVSAAVPGVDYESVFEVPIFRTPASALPPTQSDLQLSGNTDRSIEYQQPRDSSIVVSRNQRGTEIIFPAARNWGAASSISLFSALWGAVILLLLQLKAPVLFPIVFGVFEVLLLVGALQLWAVVSRVVVNKGSISLAQGYFYPGAQRTFRADEIAQITTRIGMQAGSRPYYDVVLVSNAGKQIAAGRWIRDKREAEWLAATMQQAFGVEPISRAEPGSRTLR